MFRDCQINNSKLEIEVNNNWKNTIKKNTLINNSS